MSEQNQNECRCAQATCGCDAATVVRCTCGERCSCESQCRCAAGCDCAAKQ